MPPARAIELRNEQRPIDSGLGSCDCFMHVQLPKHFFVNWHGIMGTQSGQEMTPFFLNLIILISVERYHSNFITNVSETQALSGGSSSFQTVASG